ncbi:hypothetical protein [Acidovorax sp. PRC11]|uniref:hypothetical protein n=1 Tax=Acidovorax sp. PRC11 TaxID=2962592 RepID=UPI0028825BB8|nr:hypothetical protein [Acidovorax sp. PRC11]MDT0137109.1 hypothetical protein [Acidovorax sp. PRC11]
MRRWLLLLLLTLLPIQWTWAEAAGYCAHEPAAALQHFGHHAHQHAEASGSGDASVSSLAGIDQDCGACHAGCALALIDLSLPCVSPVMEALPPRTAGALRAPPPALPDRPNWPRLA